jgi:hypothetical protein
MAEEKAISGLRFPAMADNWPSICNAVIANDEGGVALASALFERWSTNSIGIKPSGLDPDPEGILEFSWSELLGYAVAQEGFSSLARANLVAGFRAAFRRFEPELTKGAVWLADCLALRNIQYHESEEGIALAAMDLMLAALGKIPEQLPTNDAANYAQFHDIYDLASTVLVAELGETKFMDASFLAGKRLLPASHTTLFAHMSLNSDRGSAQPMNGGDAKTGIAQVQNWRQGADRCRELIDGLFDTLMSCNPDFSREKRFSPDAIFSHARELDLAWFRFAHRYSDWRVGGAVIRELKNLRKNEDSLFAIDNSQLKLGQNLPIVLVVFEQAKNLGSRILSTFQRDIDRISSQAELQQRLAA